MLRWFHHVASCGTLCCYSYSTLFLELRLQKLLAVHHIKWVCVAVLLHRACCVYYIRITVQRRDADCRVTAGCLLLRTRTGFVMYSECASTTQLQCILPLYACRILALGATGIVVGLATYGTKCSACCSLLSRLQTSGAPRDLH
jgi:hypothetical protein